MDEHHATLLCADTLASAALPDAYRQQSADVLHVVRERFGIDDARELSAIASQTPFAAPVRVFVVVAGDIAPEAQNALLKLFEEPPKHARFYLIVPSVSFLLPTLRSRLHSPSGGASQDVYVDSFSAFRNASYGERLVLIAQLAKDKNREAMEAIIRGCEHAAQCEDLQNAALLRSVLFVRTYSGSRGASLKMLLEELALTLPA